MDGNKDEALRCVVMAEEAIASGKKDRALRFIKIAQRLNRDLSLDHLLSACGNLDTIGSKKPPVDHHDNAEIKSKNKEENESAAAGAGGGGEGDYTEENVGMIRQITRGRDYYEILGVGKGSSGEEIKRAYKKLSLKVHPDKNKAPGAEEAFKKVFKAFKCLSDGDSRRQYDLTGLADGFEEYQQEYSSNVRQRRAMRRRNGASGYYYESDHHGCNDDFDEVLRACFGESGGYRGHNFYRSRGMGSQYREEFHGGGGGGGGGGRGGPNWILLLQILPFLLILLLAYLPFPESDFSLRKNQDYQFLKTTEKYGVEFFVKSLSFDDIFPIGSPARAKLEESVIKEYRNMLWRYCHIEMQRRHWSKNSPIPCCIKLQNLGTS